MLIDSHAHLDMADFDEDRTEVIDRATKGGLTHIITVGVDLKSSIRALDIAKQSEIVYCAVGYHPHDAHACTSRDLDKLVRISSEPEVVAWGEIGLDFYRNHSTREEQLDIFSRQLKIAHDLNLPVIIHDREAHHDILDILQKMGKGQRKGVIHCFSGDTELALSFIGLGYYISIPGTVTYKNASRIKKVASSIPLDSMLIETDAPFLAPIPNRGKRNEPLFVKFTAEEVARLRGIGIEDLGRATSSNAKTLFELG